MEKVKPKYAKIVKLVKKIKAINYLGAKCSCCGENNFFKLAFHHIYQNQKEENVSCLFDKHWSTIEKEIKKCELLCHNCHVEKHYNDKINKKESRFFINKKVFLEFKGEKKCYKCGYCKYTGVLEFHHIEDDKNFNLSSVNKTIKTVFDLEEKIIKELNKCDILCKNCHVLEHSDVLFFEENKNFILNKVKEYKNIQKKINREEVYKLFDSGLKQVEIAKYFNASKGTISDILKTYKKTEDDKRKLYN